MRACVPTSSTFQSEAIAVFIPAFWVWYPNPSISTPLPSAPIPVWQALSTIKSIFGICQSVISLRRILSPLPKMINELSGAPALNSAWVARCKILWFLNLDSIALRLKFSSVRVTEFWKEFAIVWTSLMVAGRPCCPNFSSLALPPNAPARMLGWVFCLGEKSERL